MIVYDGTQQPCIGQRQEPPRCANLSKFRAETKHAFIHVCAECAAKLGAAWTLVELTGREVLNGSSLDPIELMRRTPWILEIDGVTREVALAE